MIWFAIPSIEHCVLVSLFRNISRFNCMASTIVCHNLLNTILIYFGVAAVTFSFLPFFLPFLLFVFIFLYFFIFFNVHQLQLRNYSLLQCGQYLNPYWFVGFRFVLFWIPVQELKSLSLSLVSLWTKILIFISLKRRIQNKHQSSLKKHDFTWWNIIFQCPLLKKVIDYFAKKKLNIFATADFVHITLYHLSFIQWHHFKR